MAPNTYARDVMELGAVNAPTTHIRSVEPLNQRTAHELEHRELHHRANR